MKTKRKREKEMEKRNIILRFHNFCHSIIHLDIYLNIIMNKNFLTYFLAIFWKIVVYRRLYWSVNVTLKMFINWN